MNHNQNICDALAGPGWISIPNYLDANTVHELNLISISRNALFKKAGIGANDSHQVQQSVRGDSVLWVEKSDSEMQSSNQRMEDLRNSMNKELYLGLENFDWHFASYPVGSFYQRHLDQHQNDDTRSVTVVQYLNENWQDTFGGQLRLFLENGNHVDIVPHCGTMVVFLSEKFEHEVLAATTVRLSLTGWYRRRSMV